MRGLRYPIGMQTFSNIIEEGYSYVDKTGYIKPLLNHGKYIFLSRPRRFGKSLLLSTLEAYFKGRRDLFKGLAADRMDLDWTSSPVLRFDLNAEDYSHQEGLNYRLDGFLRDYEKIYGRNQEDTTPARRFEALIKAAYEHTGRKVVILIDEYDKPLLEVEENMDLFEKNRRTLKGFYGNLKSMDEYIRFVFITGVARFGKVSIFSDLNNLKDISITDTYADICGWTETELVENFRPGIEALAHKRREDFETTLRALRDYYDGYLFTPEGSRLYNPFSVLNALDDKKIRPYWYATGTPTFLARRVKARGVYPPDINGKLCSEDELTSVGLEDSNPIPLMFQTGYLTIWSYKEELDLYELRFPNREVEMGFYNNLLKVYVPNVYDPTSPFNFHLFKIDLYEGRPDDFMKRLDTLFRSLPGEDHNESVYRAVTFLLAELSGTRAIAERHSYLGRSDLEIVVGSYVYLFEFKYNRSVREAMEQIHTRDYAGRYAMDGRTVYLIGANFNEKKEQRGLEYEIEKMKVAP